MTLKTGRHMAGQSKPGHAPQPNHFKPNVPQKLRAVTSRISRFNYSSPVLAVAAWYMPEFRMPPFPILPGHLHAPKVAYSVDTHKEDSIRSWQQRRSYVAVAFNPET